jgi:hypothetical protein
MWDCFGSSKGFTSDLHITLNITQNYHDISITVPNSAKKRWKRLQEIFKYPGYEQELFSILGKLRKKVPHLFIEFNQRHFVAQKFGIRDGFMEFNIDTFGSPFREKKSKTKEFPIWRDAIESAIRKKKGINGQVMFRSRFFLNQTKRIETPKFIETAKKTVASFKPLYEFLRSDS